MGRRTPHEYAHPQVFAAGEGGGVVNPDPAVNLIVQAHLAPRGVVVARELHAVHAQVARHEPRVFRILRVDLGQRDEGAAVLGPGPDLGQLTQGRARGEHRPVPDLPWQGAQPRHGRGRVAPGGTQHAGRVGAHLDGLAHALEGAAEQETRALQGTEQVAHGGERGALDALEQQRRPPRGVHPPLHQGHDQVRVHGRLDAAQVTVPFQVEDGVAERSVQHGAAHDATGAEPPAPAA